MTEPYMAKGLDKNKLSPMAQEATFNSQRYGWRSLLGRFAWVVCIGWCGMALTGCSDFWSDVGDLFRIGGGGNAEAQTATERRVETFVINTDGFLILVDNDGDPTPAIEEVSDGATRFKMASEGTMVLGVGGNDSISLEIDDTIILRLNGENGSATLIRKD